jgi:3-oxoacyl-[acyl-carrier-protein] synthase III
MAHVNFNTPADAYTDFQFPPASSNPSGGYFRIASIAQHLPSTQKTTAQLLEENGLTLRDKVIIRATGVESRHIADENQCDSDFLCAAADSCLTSAKVGVDGLSRIFVNKLLGDRILPPTSALVQRKLNAHTAVQCMDIDGGTNGFLQAFLMAGRCLDTGDHAVLIASGGVHQKLMNQRDSRTAYLFGDGACAMLLQASEKKHLLAHYEFSNPSLSHLHHAVDFYDFVPGYLKGEGLSLFSMGNLNSELSFYLKAARHTMDVLLESARCHKDDIDMFFINQINLPLWQSIVEHLDIPENKRLSLLPRLGNTLSAGIPLQMCQWQNQQSDLKNKKIMLLSLGEGLLGGGCIYDYQE